MVLIEELSKQLHTILYSIVLREVVDDARIVLHTQHPLQSDGINIFNPTHLAL